MERTSHTCSERRSGRVALLALVGALLLAAVAPATAFAASPAAAPAPTPATSSTGAATQDAGEEFVPPNGICAALDDEERVRVENTTTYPQSAVVNVNVGGADGVFASGYLVAPDVVATAAHVVTAESGEPVAVENVTVAPAIDDRELPYGAHDVESVWVDPEYDDVDNESVANLRQDFALLGLPEPVGLETGTFELARAPPGENDTVANAGYPLDRPIRTMWRHSARARAVVKDSEPAWYGTDLEICHGSSGSPVWTADDGVPTARGTVVWIGEPAYTGWPDVDDPDGPPVPYATGYESEQLAQIEATSSFDAPQFELANLSVRGADRRDPLAVRPGSEFTVAIEVENVGERAARRAVGYSDAGLPCEGRDDVVSRSISLDPGERGTVAIDCELSRTADAGSATLSAVVQEGDGSHELALDVLDGANGSASEVEVEIEDAPAVATTGGAATVTATASNDGDAAASGDVSLSVGDQTVATSTLTVPADGRETVTLNGTVPADASTGETTLTVASDAGSASAPLRLVADCTSVDGRRVCDASGDGLYRDLNADGRVTHADVQAFFAVQHRPDWKQPSLFDCNDNEVVGHGDVLALFERVATGTL